MVRGLVEEQKVGLGEEEAAQRDATALATGEGGDVGVARRAAQRVHRDVERALQLPAVAGVDLLLQLALLGHQIVHRVVVERLGEPGRDLVEAVEQRLRLRHRLHDVAEHVLAVVELRLLLEKAHLDALGGPGLARIVVVQPRHDLQERGLAGAVDAEDADLGAGQECERDVLQDLLPAREGFCQIPHHIDVLVGRHRHASSRAQGVGIVAAAFISDAA